MNRTLVIAIVLLALLTAGGLGAFLVLSNRSQVPSTTQNTSTQQTSENTTANKSIKDLFTMQGSQQCSFTDESGSSGTVYIQNGKMSGNFTSTTPQGTMSSHMLVDGPTAYMWVDGQTTGFKMSFDPSTFTAPQGDNTVDFDQPLNYDCTSWTGSGATFALPTGVTFTDFGALAAPSTPEAGSSGTPALDTKALQCAACNSLPADSQAACKSALGCN